MIQKIRDLIRRKPPPVYKPVVRYVDYRTHVFLHIDSESVSITDLCKTLKGWEVSTRPDGLHSYVTEELISGNMLHILSAPVPDVAGPWRLDWDYTLYVGLEKTFLADEVLVNSRIRVSKDDTIYVRVRLEDVDYPGIYHYSDWVEILLDEDHTANNLRGVK